MKSNNTDVMKTQIERRRCIGLSIGALWMVAVGASFVIWSLLAIRTSWAILVLIFVDIITLVLIVISIVVIRAALHLQKDIQQGAPKKNVMIRWFILIVILEVVVCAAINIIATNMGQFEIIPSLVLIVVGLHFIPLARIFRVPRYYLTGSFFIIIPVMMLIWVPKEFMVGYAPAWYVVPGLGCGLIVFLTAMAGLNEAWNTISKSQTLIG